MWRHLVSPTINVPSIATVYCNSLPASLASCQMGRIQYILYDAVRIIYGRTQYDHMASFLRNRLHWLCFAQRVKYKCCLLIYKALHGQAPTYIRQFCTKFARRHTTISLCQDKKTKFGNRSFSVAGPAAWNSLPDDIRTSPYLVVFNNRLKTHLFRKSYSS